MRMISLQLLYAANALFLNVISDLFLKRRTWMNLLSMYNLVGLGLSALVKKQVWFSDSFFYSDYWCSGLETRPLPIRVGHCYTDDDVQRYSYSLSNATTRLGRCYFLVVRKLMHFYQRTFGGLSDDEFDQMSDSAMNELYRLFQQSFDFWGQTTHSISAKL